MRYIRNQFNTGRARIARMSEKTLFSAILCLFFAALGAYIYLAAATNISAVMGNKVEKGNATLLSRVGELELTYLSKTNHIDLRLAYSLGFVDAVRTTFASRGEGGEVLTLAGQ